jgi:hypothetical protein
MRGLLRLLAAAAVVGALAALLRELLRDRPELLGVKRTEEHLDAAETAPHTTRDSAGPSRKELYEEAQRLEIQGRSKMNKRQLERAVDEAKGAGR